MRLVGKITLVTGAGGGFDAGIAKPVTADIDPKVAEAVAGKLGASAVQGNVRQRSDAPAMADAAVEHHGGLDIVVNGAATTHRNQPLLDVSEADFDRVYAVNVKSIDWMTQAVVPLMRQQKRGGSIIKMSSPVDGGRCI